MTNWRNNHKHLNNAGRRVSMPCAQFIANKLTTIKSVACVQETPR